MWGSLEGAFQTTKRLGWFSIYFFIYWSSITKRKRIPKSTSTLEITKIVKIQSWTRLVKKECLSKPSWQKRSNRTNCLLSFMNERVLFFSRWFNWDPLVVFRVELLKLFNSRFHPSSGPGVKELVSMLNYMVKLHKLGSCTLKIKL